MIANSAFQSWTFYHNAILFINTYNSAYYEVPHWLLRTPYLVIIASNDMDRKTGTLALLKLI